MAEALNKLLLQPADDELKLAKDARRFDALALQLFRMAKGGDIRAIKEINERTDGKARETIDLHDSTDRRAKVINYRDLSMIERHLKRAKAALEEKGSPDGNDSAN